MKFYWFRTKIPCAQAAIGKWCSINSEFWCFLIGQVTHDFQYDKFVLLIKSISRKLKWSLWSFQRQWITLKQIFCLFGRANGPVVCKRLLLLGCLQTIRMERSNMIARFWLKDNLIDIHFTNSSHTFYQSHWFCILRFKQSPMFYSRVYLVIIIVDRFLFASFPSFDSNSIPHFLENDLISSCVIFHLNEHWTHNVHGWKSIFLWFFSYWIMSCCCCCCRFFNFVLRTLL